jgi:hypothetical protein
MQQDSQKGFRTVVIETPKPRFRRKKIPPHAPPVVQRIFERANELRLNYDDIHALSGVDEKTILRWKNGVEPTLNYLESVLEALGLELTTVPKSE